MEMLELPFPPPYHFRKPLFPRRSEGEVSSKSHWRRPWKFTYVGEIKAFSRVTKGPGRPPRSVKTLDLMGAAWNTKHKSSPWNTNGFCVQFHFHVTFFLKVQGQPVDKTASVLGTATHNPGFEAERQPSAGYAYTMQLTLEWLGKLCKAQTQKWRSWISWMCVIGLELRIGFLWRFI